MPSPVDAVIERILDAHGGAAYWESLSAVEVEFSARGFLFTAKGITRQSHARLTANTREPHVVLWNHPVPGQRAELDGTREVRILDDAGTVLASRTDPRAAFGDWRHALRWDALDFTYFAGYAWWNYLSWPFLLRAPGMEVTELPCRTAGLTRLQVRFPPGLPTHCPTQELYFDAEGQLVRHDYTAEVVGGWARAAHLCSDYRQFDGLWMPTRRRVYPKGPGGRPLPAPTLVALDIHDAHPVG